MKTYYDALYTDIKFQKMNPIICCHEITRQLVLLELEERCNTIENSTKLTQISL